MTCSSHGVVRPYPAVEVQQQGESKGTEVARHTIDKQAREDGGGGCIVGGILYREADGVWVMRHNYAVTARNTW